MAKVNGCEIERPDIRRNPWNVTAPDGERFVEGPHSLLAWSKEEAIHIAKHFPRETCPDDCDCRY